MVVLGGPRPWPCGGQRSFLRLCRRQQPLLAFPGVELPDVLVAHDETAALGRPAAARQRILLEREVVVVRDLLARLDVAKGDDPDVPAAVVVGLAVRVAR